MSVTGPSNSAALDAATRVEIDRLRASGALGESGRLRELFDFLAARTADDAPPKEAEIAVALFGRSETDIGRDDPAARVYIHRLRKRLDSFYKQHGEAGVPRLVIPKGEYRLATARPEADAAEGAAAQAAAPKGRGIPAAAMIAAALVLLAVANLAGWALFARGGDGAPEAAKDPVWAGMAEGDRPLVVAVGDYFLFGDYGDSPILRRLVRDFSINSPADLLQRRLESDEAFDRYTDVNLRYLPISAAFALAEVFPVLRDAEDARVMLASDLTAETIRDSDIVYVGMISGMAMLRDPVFTGSRFEVGSSFDELRDTETGDLYISGAFQEHDRGGGLTRDYGLFRAFDGPNGNRIMVIAGTRDTAVTGVAERVTRAGSLAELHAALPGAAPDGALEALYEFEGRDHVALDGRVLAAAPVDSAEIWSADNAPGPFPSE